MEVVGSEKRIDVSKDRQMNTSSYIPVNVILSNHKNIKLVQAYL